MFVPVCKHLQGLLQLSVKLLPYCLELGRPREGISALNRSGDQANRGKLEVARGGPTAPQAQAQLTESSAGGGSGLGASGPQEEE